MVNELEPPPPAILISITFPVFLNVLPAPTKFNVRTVPIATLPDCIPTIGSESVIVTFPDLPKNPVTPLVDAPAKPICLTCITVPLAGADANVSELDPVPDTEYDLVFCESDGY